MATMDPRRDSIYRLIRWLFLADIVGGLLLAGLGTWMWPSPPAALAGAGLAAIGLLLFFFFGALARRAAGRQVPPDRR
jgi:hypothetical protein